ncbi:GNAT family N-acetyltransferase [Paeniglutamicibacter sp. NPDC012692]|uniref:GNAT family N-acetyltransferase n=1 Tax=Paeniglutamicibacter sp. NPDC012692 TaxID=3364388 RepID=UPI00367DCD59
MTNFVIEKAGSRRDLSLLARLYEEVLAASPNVLPESPGDLEPSEVFVAVTPLGKLLGGLTLSRNNLGTQQVVQSIGMPAAIRWAHEYTLLSHLAVHPNYQGQGVGTALLKHAIQATRNAGGLLLFGFAEEHNGRASASFYEKHSFTLRPDWEDGFEIGGFSYISPVKRTGTYFAFEVTP